MVLLTSKQFDKKLLRVPWNIRRAYLARIHLFLIDPQNSVLHNHPLQGTYRGTRSINITGDYRLIFEQLGNDTIRLLEIDTHHNLYGT
ncbi:MAG: toxin of the YafQ-DinJ toxin-antitoxin system [Parcubacteria group bacterium]|nr:toxin of the YafQ-DinJ toxin-antitoxin system [Parcubacteria group bacterium]